MLHILLFLSSFNSLNICIVVSYEMILFLGSDFFLRMSFCAAVLWSYI